MYGQARLGTYLIHRIALVPSILLALCLGRSIRQQETLIDDTIACWTEFPNEKLAVRNSTTNDIECVGAIPGTHAHHVRLAAYHLQQICGPAEVHRDCLSDAAGLMSAHHLQTEVTLADIDITQLQRWIENEATWSASNVSSLTWTSFRHCRPWSGSTPKLEHRIDRYVIQSYLDLVAARADDFADTLPSVFVFPVSITGEALLAEVIHRLTDNDEGFPADILSRDVWLIPLLGGPTSADHVRAAAVDIKNTTVCFYDSHSDDGVRADMKVSHISETWFSSSNKWAQALMPDRRSSRW